MPLPVEGGLVTVTDLENHLHRTISTKDDPAAQAAVDFATALVWDVVGFDVTGDDATIRRTTCRLSRGIALRIAAQWFTNPEDRRSTPGRKVCPYTASPQMLSRIG